MAYTPFAQRLIWLKERRDLTNADLARMADVHKTQVGKWLKPVDDGPSWPGLLQAWKLSEGLGVSVDALLAGELDAEEGQDPGRTIISDLYQRLEERDREALLRTAETWADRTSPLLSTMNEPALAGVGS